MSGSARSRVGKLFVAKPAEIEMAKYLVRQLLSGKLEAIGVMTKPDLGAGPQQIPAFIFKAEPRVNFAKNTLENFGRKFEGVEIRAPVLTEPDVTIPSAAISSAAISSTVAALGRPSKAEEINKAIDGLMAQGVDLAIDRLPDPQSPRRRNLT
jgi:hypothetical protein